MIYPEKLNSQWSLTKYVNFEINEPFTGNIIISPDDGTPVPAPHIVTDETPINPTIPPSGPTSPLPES